MEKFINNFDVLKIYIQHLEPENRQGTEQFDLRRWPPTFYVPLMSKICRWIPQVMGMAANFRRPNYRKLLGWPSTSNWRAQKLQNRRIVL
jgi:hypothetical protein